jgi:hypothetical protein
MTFDEAAVTRLVGGSVIVSFNDSAGSVTGILHSVDPETGACTLLVESPTTAGSFSATVVFPHCIQDVAGARSRRALASRAVHAAWCTRRGTC